MKEKVKVLCVCAVGINRSKYLADYLRRQGYSTRYGGIDYREEGDYNPLKQKDVDWADVVVIARKRLESIFQEKYNSKGKKIIVLDVTDSRRTAIEHDPTLAALDNATFQKRWTRPKLREAVEKYLPLRKRDLEGKVSGTTAIIGLLGSIFFLSSNLTGNVILNLSLKTSNIMGLVLFFVGAIGAFVFFKRR